MIVLLLVFLVLCGAHDVTSTLITSNSKEVKDSNELEHAVDGGERDNIFDWNPFSFGVFDQGTRKVDGVELQNFAEMPSVEWTMRSLLAKIRAFLVIQEGLIASRSYEAVREEFSRLEIMNLDHLLMRHIEMDEMAGLIVENQLPLLWKALASPLPNVRSIFWDEIMMTIAQDNRLHHLLCSAHLVEALADVAANNLIRGDDQRELLAIRTARFILRNCHSLGQAGRLESERNRTLNTIIAINIHNMLDRMPSHLIGIDQIELVNDYVVFFPALSQHYIRAMESNENSNIRSLAFYRLLQAIITVDKVLSIAIENGHIFDVLEGLPVEELFEMRDALAKLLSLLVEMRQDVSGFTRFKLTQAFLSHFVSDPAPREHRGMRPSIRHLINHHEALQLLNKALDLIPKHQKAKSILNCLSEAKIGSVLLLFILSKRMRLEEKIITEWLRVMVRLVRLAHAMSSDDLRVQLESLPSVLQDSRAKWTTAEQANLIDMILNKTTDEIKEKRLGSFSFGH